MEEEYEEKTTPKGFLIKIKADKSHYIVFTSSGPEIPKNTRGQSINVKIPRVVFIGKSFDVSHFDYGQINYVNVKSSKMAIPYAHGDSREIKSIFLNSGSQSDVLPVIIYYFRDASQLDEKSADGKMYDHVIIDDDFERASMVKLKIRYPRLNILIIKKKVTARAEREVASPVSEVVDKSRIRASDMVEENNLNVHSGNPVFLARIHLRNLELDKVKQLLLDFNLTPDDVVFIRTFLDVMRKNENGKEELERNKSKIAKLDRNFYLASLVLSGKEMEFEEELSKKLEKDDAFMMYALLEKEQDRASELKTQLLYWEWKLRSKKMFQNP